MTEPREPARNERLLQQTPHCAVSLTELCVNGGSDAGSDMEIKLDIRHAGRDGTSPNGVWDAFTAGHFRDVPKDGCADITGTITPIGNGATVGIRIEEDDGNTFFNENEHFSWTFSDVCAQASASGELSYPTSDGTFVFKVEAIETDAELSCEENIDLSPRAQNGDACSASGQCASGCCSKNFFGANSCQNDAWFRTCVIAYMYRRGSEAESQCGEGSPVGQINIVSYNLYLIALASDSPFSIDDRADDLADWFAASSINADVVVIQENWLFQDEIETGMIQAGYCHHVYDDRGSFGSGMAVYSRHPIEENDFRSFDSICTDEECLVDKGVAYTKIRKDGSPIHVFGTHFQASPDNHGTRLGQSALMRNFASEKVSDTSEAVFFVGDFNEDRIADEDEYNAILDSLDAKEIVISGDPYSYDPDTNNLINPGSLGASGRREALDFILYDERQCRAYPNAETSSCRYLKPTDVDGNDLSDHYPLFCEMKF